MKYTELGMTGLQVSKVCFGTWSYGGDWGAADLDQGRAAIRAARDLGVNFFDTAQAYGFGAAEGLLAESLRQEINDHRDGVVIATKGGLRDDGDRHVRDASAGTLRQGLEQSLKVLGTDYVDVYLLHWPDSAVTFQAVGETLESFVRAGMARCVGVSNFDVEQLRQLRESGPVQVIQPPFHLFRREAQAELLPYCEGEGIGVFSYGSLAHGLLSGRPADAPRSFPDGDWRARSSIFRGESLRVNGGIVAELATLAADIDLTVPQLAIAWVLAQDGIDASIVGARSPEQITETAHAGDVELSREDLARIDEITKGFFTVGGAAPGAIW